MGAFELFGTACDGCGGGRCRPVAWHPVLAEMLLAASLLRVLLFADRAAARAPLSRARRRANAWHLQAVPPPVTPLS